MTVRRRKQASVGKLLLGYLGVLALIAYMSLVPGLWKMALFGLRGDEGQDPATAVKIRPRGSLP
jgi:hypothetical protein